MALKEPIWLKAGKCDVRISVSRKIKGGPVGLQIWIPASVAERLIVQRERPKRRSKKK